MRWLSLKPWIGVAIDKKKGLGIICGDLDSVHSETLQYYEKKGVKIVKDTDQYSTDLTKCLKFADDNLDILEMEEGHAPSHLDLLRSPRVDVAIFGGLGGRGDQAFSELHHLYVLAERQSSSWFRDVYLVTKESLMFLLEKGLNKIHTHVKRQYFTENVGIIPIGRPSVITTRGLEWDVKDWPTEFGAQISTSNHIKADVVEVESTQRVLFTLEFDPRHQN